MSNTNYPPGPPMGQPYYQQPAPPPPAKKKRGWVKTGAIATGTFIFGLIIGSCGGGDNNSANNAPYVEPTTVASQGASAPAPAATSKAPEATAVPIGQKGTVGAITVTVKNVDCSKPSWDPDPANKYDTVKTKNEGYQLCVITTEVANASSSPVHNYFGNTSVTDSSGNRYNWDSGQYLDYSSKSELNPTEKTAHDFVFQIPDGQTAVTLNVVTDYGSMGPVPFALK